MIIFVELENLFLGSMGEIRILCVWIERVKLFFYLYGLFYKCLIYWV